MLGCVGLALIPVSSLAVTWELAVKLLSSGDAEEGTAGAEDGLW